MKIRIESPGLHISTSKHAAKLEAALGAEHVKTMTFKPTTYWRIDFLPYAGCKAWAHTSGWIQTQYDDKHSAMLAIRRMRESEEIERAEMSEQPRGMLITGFVHN